MGAELAHATHGPPRGPPAESPWPNGPAGLWSPPMRGGAAVTIGSFDGVHLGHAGLVRAARQAVGDHGKVTVLCFDAHPLSGKPLQGFELHFVQLLT